jgi:hypothetical protein
MKVITTAIAALSVAALTSPAPGQSAAEHTIVVPAATPAAAGPAVLAQYRYRYQYRYRDSCDEDLGYGRTGSYGCGG